jgi:uracil phosphoribosyltransferase
MVDALTSLLPDPVPIHHLGLYREKSTLQPVEYYNNLPYHRSTASTSSRGGRSKDDDAGPAELAIIIDPVVATGATAMAAVETLRDWGVRRVIVVSVLGSREGLRRVCECWGEESNGEGLEAVHVFCGGLDEETDSAGMIKPGLGDVGDRLYLTMGK